MDQRRFDAVTRGMATHGTRRSVLRGLAGFAAGSLAAIGLGQAGRLAKALQAADSEEQSVLLYEHMALIARSHVGSCAELGAKLTSFANEHAELFKALRPGRMPGPMRNGSSMPMPVETGCRPQVLSCWPHASAAAL